MEPMRLSDLAKRDSKFFLKSVYGPVNESWPALSYTQPALKAHLDRHYRPGSDFILLTGTAGKNTESPYRGRLLSALIVDLTKTYRTEEIVPRESWQHAQREYPGQWIYSLGVLQAWTFKPQPLTVDVLPNSYPQMGQYPFRGSVREIEAEERERIIGLDIAVEPLGPQPAIKPALTFQALLADEVLNREAVRVATLITHRVNASGSLALRTAPDRMANPKTDLILIVAEMMRQQPLCCALCGGLLALSTKNKLLQVSPDRKDSGSGSYGPENFQLAHLGCNLAKNDASEQQFHEWLDTAAGRVPTIAD